MAQQSGGPTPPVNRANQVGQASNPSKVASSPPPSQGGTQQEGSRKKRFFFRSSQASTNIHLPQGGEPARFRDYHFVTDIIDIVHMLRNDFVNKQRGPLQVEEISEEDYNKRRNAPQEAGETVDVSSSSVQETNRDGVDLTQPVISPLPGQQNMMNYPQPPLESTPPTPGPHVAPEISTDPANAGSPAKVDFNVRTQAHPGKPEEATTRPQDIPNVPFQESGTAPMSRKEADKKDGEDKK